MTEQEIDNTEYVKRTAKLINLNISPKYLAGVTDNFTKIAAIAALVNEFDLPENIQTAPKFEP